MSSNTRSKKSTKSRKPTRVTKIISKKSIKKSAKKEPQKRSKVYGQAKSIDLTRSQLKPTSDKDPKGKLYKDAHSLAKEIGSSDIAIPNKELSKAKDSEKLSWVSLPIVDPDGLSRIYQKALYLIPIVDQEYMDKIRSDVIKTQQFSDRTKQRMYNHLRCIRVYEEILDAMNSFGYRNGGREKTSFLQKMPRGCDRSYTYTGRAFYKCNGKSGWQPPFQEEPRAAGLAHSEIIALNALKINDGDKTKAKSFVIDNINNAVKQLIKIADASESPPARSSSSSSSSPSSSSSSSPSSSSSSSSSRPQAFFGFGVVDGIAKSIRQDGSSPRWMDNNNFESVRDHCDLLMAIKPSFIAENVDARDISRLAIALYKTNWYHYWNLEGTMVTRLDGTLFWEDVPRRNQRSPTPSTLVMGSAHDRRQRLSQEDLRKLRDRNMDKARLLIRLELLRLMFLKKVVHLKFKNKRYERLSSRNALRRVLMADGKPATWPSGDPIFPESPRKKKKTTLKKRGLVEKITSFFGLANGEGRGEERGEGRGEGSRSESSSVSSESSTKSYDPREMLSSDSLSSRSSSSDVSHELSVGSSLLNKPFSTRGPLHREVHAYRGLRLPSPEVAHLLLTPYRNNIKASNEFQPPPPWQQSCQGPDRPSGPELPRTAFSRMTGMVATTAYSDDEDEIESE